MKNIIAIILSGGDSSRMGSPKALLLHKGRTFLQHCITSFSHASIKNIIVVTGTSHREIENFVNEHSLNVILIYNERHDEGQYSSLQTAFTSLPKNTDAVIVQLVDHPLVKKETVDEIIHQFIMTNASILIPSYQHRRGHPVLYSSKLFHEIVSTTPEHGARSIHQLHKDEIEFVDVDDEGVRIDIDTQEDYMQWCK